MSNETHDVMIIGAGPAGATAAITLAQAGHSVALIDKAVFPTQNSHLGWLNAKALPLLDELGLKEDAIERFPFTDVTFLSGDLLRKTTPNVAEAPAVLIDRGVFANVMVDRAKKAGATLITGSAVVEIQAFENTVVATLANEQKVEAKLLLMASGVNSHLLERLGFPPPTSHSMMWTSLVGQRLEPGVYDGPPATASVLGMDREGSFAIACITKDQISVCINWLGEEAQTRSKLAFACEGLYSKNLVPLDLSAMAEEATVYKCPTSAALDMETHTGKHTLLIGDAGGFIAAISNEGLFPAIWSAKIASKVVTSALTNPQSQDELMQFESEWRTTMAEYLRPPNTDLQFLLPLIFSNQPMADRMCTAFFNGENI